jgi:hypothetical protein
MKVSLLSRLVRLEARRVASEPVVFRYGWLRPLPVAYVGERHVATVKTEPTGSFNVESCEFEERSGSAPVGYGPCVCSTARTP